jgi:DNA-binding transcriptional LysR family regulator
MADNISWDLYRSFLGVLREGSLSGAARTLGITQPTVGRHIAALEAALDQVLFIRAPSGLLPTEAAQALQLHAVEMESAAAAFDRTAQSRGEGVQGCVRVTASEIIAIEVLPRILAPLRECYPDLRIELVPSNQIQDLLRREADVAVRMVRPEQQQLLARRIGALELGLHASPAYVERHGLPASFAALRQHSLIGFDAETPFIRSQLKNLRGLQREDFSLRTDSDLAQLALMRAGAGIGVCQVALARTDTNLVRVLPAEFSLPLETWLTMHEDLRHSPRCRVTFDALAEGLKQYMGER